MVKAICLLATIQSVSYSIARQLASLVADNTRIKASDHLDEVRESAPVTCLHAREAAASSEYIRLIVAM